MNTPPCTSRNKSSVAGHRKPIKSFSDTWPDPEKDEMALLAPIWGIVWISVRALSSRDTLRKACGANWKWKVECPETQNHGGQSKSKCWISAESKSMFMSLLWNSVKKKVWKNKCYFPQSPRQHLFPACRGSHICFGRSPVFPALF